MAVRFVICPMKRRASLESLPSRVCKRRLSWGPRSSGPWLWTRYGVRKQHRLDGEAGPWGRKRLRSEGIAVAKNNPLTIICATERNRGSGVRQKTQSTRTGSERIWPHFAFLSIFLIPWRTRLGPVINLLMTSPVLCHALTTPDLRCVPVAYRLLSGPYQCSYRAGNGSHGGRSAHLDRRNAHFPNHPQAGASYGR